MSTYLVSDIIKHLEIIFEEYIKQLMNVLHVRNRHKRKLVFVLLFQILL